MGEFFTHLTGGDVVAVELMMVALAILIVSLSGSISQYRQYRRTCVRRKYSPHVGYHERYGK